MEIRRARAAVMETVRERSERESMESELESSRMSRPQMRFVGRWCRLNPFLSWWMRILCILCAFTLVIVVGVVVYRSGLSNKRQEIRLKCENRKEVFMSEVDNNLGASFVILGLVTSVTNVDQDTWLAFTEQTLFLRPHVRSLVYCLRVMPEQKQAVEKKYNATMYIVKNKTKITNYPQEEEYTPVVLQSANISMFMVDLFGFPIFKSSLTRARDSGNFSLSAPYVQEGLWRMGSFLPHYGDFDPNSLNTVEARRASCVGYVVTVLNVQEVFGSVVSRFKDADLDICATAKVNPSLGLNAYYNCSVDANPCEVRFYGNHTKSNVAEAVSVTFSYGSLDIELQCWYNHNIRLHVLREMIAWPLLMLAMVVFCAVAVYLVLKKMSAAEKDVDKREKIHAQLRAAKLKAEAADTAKSSFLATVSHEIRTPMNGVIGMTNLLMGTDLSPQQLEYVKIAQASGNALVALISDVLDLSKIEAGRMEIETVPFDIREELDNILSLFEEKVHQKKLEISALVHDTIPQWLYGDPGRLRQVLINLVGNAIKFTKHGNIFLCVRLVDPQFYDTVSSSNEQFLDLIDTRQRPVPETESADGSHDISLLGVMAVQSNLFRARHPQMAPPRLSMKPGPLSTSSCVAEWRNWKPSGSLDFDEVACVISIEDSGIGIPKFMQSRLFEPFVQADSSTSREYGGTGIGLSICQKLVRLTRGDITVESEPGEGSVFKFSLVLPTSGQRGDLRKLAFTMKRTPSGLGDERIRGIRVLLVDANPVRQEVAATYLRRVGALIEYAEDGSIALELLTRDDGPPFQAVIVDLQGMDHMLAIQLVQRLKESVAKKIPILALSIPPDSELQSELHKAGYQHIVHKPLRCNTLISGLLQTLGMEVTNPSRKQNADAEMLAGKRLLVVDDNMVNRRVASSILQRNGATVVTVNGGPQAINAVKKQDAEQQFDMILMDIQMPEMDGYEATRRIREWEVGKCNQCQALERIKYDYQELKECPHHRIPIVAVTADVMKGTHEMCFSAGMDDYIPKPLDQKQLQLLLERFLEHRLVNSPGSSAK